MITKNENQNIGFKQSWGRGIEKIEENIKKLKQKCILKRVGSAKGGYWEIINE